MLSLLSVRGTGLRLQHVQTRLGPCHAKMVLRDPRDLPLLPTPTVCQQEHGLWIDAPSTAGESPFLAPGTKPLRKLEKG